MQVDFSSVFFSLFFWITSLSDWFEHFWQKKDQELYLEERHPKGTYSVTTMVFFVCLFGFVAIISACFCGVASHVAAAHLPGSLFPCLREILTDSRLFNMSAGAH